VSEPVGSSSVEVGARRTRQRTEVIALLEETREFSTAQQLHARLRERGSRIGLATVYRTLRLLTDSGEVGALRLDSGEQLFRRCDSLRRHHHHLVCRSCGHTVEIHGSAVESWMRQVAEDNGFRDISHVLEIFGCCARCADGADSPSGPAGDAGSSPAC
jgi:Fur family transcriptional regulator, ferric uptake regulator